MVAKSEDLSSHSPEWEREKNKKDVTNRNRQSQTSNNITSGKLSVSVFKYHNLKVYVGIQVKYLIASDCR